MSKVKPTKLKKAIEPEIKKIRNIGILIGTEAAYSAVLSIIQDEEKKGTSPENIIMRIKSMRNSNKKQNIESNEVKTN